MPLYGVTRWDFIAVRILKFFLVIGFTATNLGDSKTTGVFISKTVVQNHPISKYPQGVMRSSP